MAKKQSQDSSPGILSSSAQSGRSPAAESSGSDHRAHVDAGGGNPGFVPIGILLASFFVAVVYMVVVDPNLTHIAMILPFLWGTAAGLAIAGMKLRRAKKLLSAVSLVLALLLALTLQYAVSNPAEVEAPTLIDGSEGN